MKKIYFIFVDLSDTLVDTDNFFKGKNVKATKEILELFGFKKTEKEILEALRVSYKEAEEFWRKKLSFFLLICRNLGIKISESKALEMDTLFRRKFLRSIKLKNSADYVLFKLREHGYKVAIISNYDESTISELLRSFRIEKYFEFIVGIDTTGVEKAKLEPFIYALNELRLKPEEVLMVGDDEHQDVIPAKRLGIKTVRILSNKAEKSEADFVIENLDSLVKLLC
jgi:FMN phosphatase YigB (HAD superfamily)